MDWQKNNESGHIIVVMTKCISGEDDNEFEKIVSDINKTEDMDDIELIQVCAKVSNRLKCNRFGVFEKLQNVHGGNLWT
jgi:hypothetical protein